MKKNLPVDSQLIWFPINLFAQLIWFPNQFDYSKIILFEKNSNISLTKKETS